MESKESPQEELKCDYLVVGAGTAGMSFVDTLITEKQSATVVLVDRNTQAGGHWTTSYPFVKLHQPSAFYGVNSLSLGKKKTWMGNDFYDIYDRATGAEVVEYYKQVCDGFKASGRVKCFFSAEYQFDKDKGIHTIATAGANLDKKKVLHVTCGKLVTVHTKVIVPSMREPLIPVDKSVSFVPVNEVTSCVKCGKYKNYIVFGAGKTGVDAITHLMDLGIDQSQITWIVSRDNWYFLRQAMENFFASYVGFADPVIASNSVKELFLMLEKNNVVGRVDPNGPFPQVIKGAVIDTKELKAIQSIQKVVRMGRATSIEPGKVLLNRGSLDFSEHDTLLVDCMAEGFYGYESFDENFTIFEPGHINLGPGLMLGNFSYSSALLAFLECNVDDDASRNSCCYFLRGKYTRSDPASLIGRIYAQVKTQEAFSELNGGMKFMFSSRTNQASPSHYTAGYLRFIWLMFGPTQAYKFGKIVTKKVESKGYSDIDHCFGFDSLGSEESEVES